MTVDYAKEIESIVTRIEVATGKTRGIIAEELGYTATYITTAISRGGNKKLLEKINAKYADVLNDTPAPTKIDQYEIALLKAFLADYIKFKASVTKMSVEDIAAEIDQNTRIALMNIGKK